MHIEILTRGKGLISRRLNIIETSAHHLRTVARQATQGSAEAEAAAKKIPENP